MLAYIEELKRRLADAYGPDLPDGVYPVVMTVGGVRKTDFVEIADGRLWCCRFREGMARQRVGGGE